MAGRDFLLIADAVAPLGDGVAPLGAAGLSRALAAQGHRTTVLTLASADAAARVPGLARRLRTVTAAVAGQTHELTLFEGRALLSDAQLREAIDAGAVLRVRPLAMTAAVILGGLAPIMWSQGTGAEVMQRIAAPMIGGMITAPLLSMFVIPAAYYLMSRRTLTRGRRSPTDGVSSQLTAA